jgi:hypothetical protein
MLYHAKRVDVVELDNFATNGFFSYETNPEKSFCNCTGDNFAYRTWTRMQAARESLCRMVNEYNTKMRIGLFQFGFNDSDDDGAKKLYDIQDLSLNITNLENFKRKVRDVMATTWTPLAEALLDVWNYYNPGTGYVPSNKQTVPTKVTDTPLTVGEWCRKNAVIIITDGESTMDRSIDRNGKSAYTTAAKVKGGYVYDPATYKSYDWLANGNGWGDADDNEGSKEYGYPDGYNPDTSTYCPKDSCWLKNNSGTDYLDDVAYFMYHQDMFLDDDDPATPEIWPGQQNIHTHVIGLDIDNDMLEETAKNGDGLYASVSNPDALGEALSKILNMFSDNQFVFTPISTPISSSSTGSPTEAVTYIPSFKGSNDSIWEGHFEAYKVKYTWGVDLDEKPNGIQDKEIIYKTYEDAVKANKYGREVVRFFELDSLYWDTRDQLKNQSSRNLYISKPADPAATLQFIPGNLQKEWFKASPEEPDILTADMTKIQQTISSKETFGDIFHSGFIYVAGPPYGKHYVPNINPKTEDGQMFSDFYKTYEKRKPMIYVGTNDGVMHKINADKDKAAGGGKEVWGFIPDEILPSLKTIVLDNQHTYTVDGSVFAEEVYFGDPAVWHTVLVFGLRQGGRAFYCLDITNDNAAQPDVLWKFKHELYSGESWSVPKIGKIQYQVSADEVVDKYVAVLSGGHAFNMENKDDVKGKAIFVVDIANGELLWALGFKQGSGEEDEENNPILNTSGTIDNVIRLTTNKIFNYPIPASPSIVDLYGNGYIDAIYFGNLGGNLFKVNIMGNADPENWTTEIVFKNDKYYDLFSSGEISSINGNRFEISGEFVKGQNIVQIESNYAYGYIEDIIDKDKNLYSVKTLAGTFKHDAVVKRADYDMMYYAPVTFYDLANQMWIAFGTGDRDRSLSNPLQGNFYIFAHSPKDANVVKPHNLYFVERFDIGASPDFNGSEGNPVDNIQNGIQVQLGYKKGVTAGINEKVFAPQWFVLPDNYMNPIVFFTTYAYDPATSNTDVCASPSGEKMKFYAFKVLHGLTDTSFEGEKDAGSISGGGVGPDGLADIFISSKESVGSAKESKRGSSMRMPYPGRSVFWTVMKR